MLNKWLNAKGIYAILFCFFFITILVILATIKDKPSITWRDIQIHELQLSVPSDWKISSYPDPGRGNSETTDITGTLIRNKPIAFDSSGMCDQNHHDVTISVNDPSSFNYTGGPAKMTAADFRAYVLKRGGTIVQERSIDDSHDLIVSKIHLGSGPCISVQYYGWVLRPDEKIWWISIRMDEERPDIVSHVYDSIQIH